MYIKQQQQIKRFLKKKNKNKVKLFSKKILRKRRKSWKRIRWEQRLITDQRKVLLGKTKKKKKIRKKDLYKKLLKKSKQKIHYTNFYLLNAFLTREGKIKSRKITKISIFEQKLISNLIQKARNFGLIPFIAEVKKELKTKWQKRYNKNKTNKGKKK
jgi:ribosomal protein S18